MTEVIKTNVSEKMQKSLDSFKSDLAKIRTGRAHTGLLDHIFIDYYGSMVPINQVAGVNLGDAKTINVQPYEKNMVAKVEKICCCMKTKFYQYHTQNIINFSLLIYVFFEN